MMSDYDPDDPRLIEAARESGLAAEYEGDPVLLRLYMKKLFVRNWAGVRTETETRYVQLARRALGKGPSEAQIAQLAKGRKPLRGTLSDSQQGSGFPWTQTHPAPKTTSDTSDVSAPANQGVFEL